MTNQPSVSIIVPLFNEAAVISDVLCGVLAVLSQEPGLIFEIVVVDDGSSDGSAQRVHDLGDERVRLVQHPYNIGNGAAVKTGIRHALGDVLVMMDGDGQHRPHDIPRLLAQVEAYDMVVGARTKESQSSWHRDAANAIYNLFAAYICSFPILDLTSGLRAIKAPLARDFVDLLPNSFSYPTTLTLAVLRSGFSLLYVPIVTQRRVGHSKINLWLDGVRFLTILFRIAVFFSPLKVFAPISALFFLTGLGWYIYRVFFAGQGFPPVSSLLITNSVIIFLIGLVSEQITYLRYSRK
jgi:glycosyltransferase involved in cell wall biosynthesis